MPLIQPKHLAEQPERSQRGERAVKALRQFVREWTARRTRKRRRSTTFVAVTGSAGKTTATELIGRMLLSLDERTQVYAGNNSLTNIVRNVIRTPSNTRFVVQEVSGGTPGAPSRAARILQHTVAVVTTLGYDHIDKLGSIAQIAQNKAALVEALPSHGVAILNADDSFIKAMAHKTRATVLTFGRAQDADLRCLSSHQRFPGALELQVSFEGNEFTLQSQLVGQHWEPVVLASALTALALGVPPEDCMHVIKTFQSRFGRCSKHAYANNAWIINDSYKAPEWALDSFFEMIKSVEAGRKTIVLGDIAYAMSDQGTLHSRFVLQALSVANRVVIVDPTRMHLSLVQSHNDGDKIVQILQSTRAASELLRTTCIPGEVIFLKSHDLHIDRIVHDWAQPITCWIDDCGRRYSCHQCDRLRSPQL
jgi:UDP-N-acetylmuramoyl-tripeptide--D-alanyl-D-alanine ligase